MQTLLTSLWFGPRPGRGQVAVGFSIIVTVMLTYLYLIGTHTLYTAHPVVPGSKLLFHGHGQPCSHCH